MEYRSPKSEKERLYSCTILCKKEIFPVKSAIENVFYFHGYKSKSV